MADKFCISTIHAIVDRQRTSLEYIFIHDKPGSSFRFPTTGGKSTELCLVTRFSPTQLTYPPVYIIFQIGIFHLVKQSLIIYLTAKLVSETDICSPTFICKGRINISLPCRFRITDRYYIIRTPVNGACHFSVTL